MLDPFNERLLFFELDCSIQTILVNFKDYKACTPNFLSTSLTNIENFLQAIPGVPKIKEGYNPATWMLEVSSTAVEAQLDIDFAEAYANSDLYR